MGCLCLTRRKNESIFIGKNNEIEIIIGEIHEGPKGQVKLYIKAPDHIPIVRKELIIDENGKVNNRSLVRLGKVPNLGIPWEEVPKNPNLF